jgi:hypothetical protein
MDTQEFADVVGNFRVLTDKNFRVGRQAPVHQIQELG